MTLTNIVFTRKEYNLIAKGRRIKERQKMSTEDLLNTFYDSRRKVVSSNRKLSKLNKKKLLKHKIFQKMI